MNCGKAERIEQVDLWLKQLLVKTGELEAKALVLLKDVKRRTIEPYED